MSAKTLYRVSGLSLVVGAVLTVIGMSFENFFFPDFQSTPLSLLLLSVIGNMLVILGLPGIIARITGRAGWLGFVGSVLTLLGVLLFTCMSFVQIIDQQLMSQLTQLAPKVAASDGPPVSAMITYMLASALFALGGILLGIAILRTRIWPRWTGLFLLLGAVLNLGSFPLSGIIGSIVSTVDNVLFVAALVWIGYDLLTSRTEEVVMRDSFTPSQARA